MTVIFLLNGVSSFPDPGDWNPVNKVECLGSGGQGGAAFVGAVARDEAEPRIPRVAGAGGGGGGYGYNTNLTPTFPVPVNVGVKNQQGISNSESPYNTYWKFYTSAVGNVYGNCGSVSSGGGTGGGGGQFYPNGFGGGTGGNSNTGFTGAQGMGGGGAAGPNGAGGIGTASTSAAVVGVGGTANGGTVAGGATSGAAGASGTQWDATHGCGGGGAGRRISTPVAGGAGGNYGGGGGGQGGDSTAPTRGNGADGLMIITYIPLMPAPAGSAIIIM